MDFKAEFEKRVAALGSDYLVRGVVTADRRVFPLGSDTKVLSTIFEFFARPLVYEIAEAHGYTVVEARAQNYYPDFTLMRRADDQEKIAVDVKTTYRDTDGNWKASFTLGGYTSFIRSPRKNIEFPFSEYAKHWIVGYIYKRAPVAVTPDHVYKLEDLDRIPTPYQDVDVFVQEKWRIAGELAGSGNTTNIGSIHGTLDDFREGRGTFETEEEFLDYWRNYERTKSTRADKFRNVREYRRWRYG